jgi:hypothetical protein
MILRPALSILKSLGHRLQCAIISTSAMESAPAKDQAEAGLVEWKIALGSEIRDGLFRADRTPQSILVEPGTVTRRLPSPAWTEQSRES